MPKAFFIIFMKALCLHKNNQKVVICLNYEVGTEFGFTASQVSKELKIAIKFLYENMFQELEKDILFFLIFFL